jgi:hypothetical protein
VEVCNGTSGRCQPELVAAARSNGAGWLRQATNNKGPTLQYPVRCTHRCVLRPRGEKMLHGSRLSMDEGAKDSQWIWNSQAADSSRPNGGRTRDRWSDCHLSDWTGGSALSSAARGRRHRAGQGRTGEGNRIHHPPSTIHHPPPATPLRLPCDFSATPYSSLETTPLCPLSCASHRISARQHRHVSSATREPPHRNSTEIPQQNMTTPQPQHHPVRPIPLVSALCLINGSASCCCCVLCLPPLHLPPLCGLILSRVVLSPLILGS